MCIEVEFIQFKVEFIQIEVEVTQIEVELTLNEVEVFLNKLTYFNLKKLAIVNLHKLHCIVIIKFGRKSEVWQQIQAPRKRIRGQSSYIHAKYIKDVYLLPNPTCETVPRRLLYMILTLTYVN